jgi:hypothetical protein
MQPALQVRFSIYISHICCQKERCVYKISRCFIDSLYFLSSTVRAHGFRHKECGFSTYISYNFQVRSHSQHSGFPQGQLLVLVWFSWLWAREWHFCKNRCALAFRATLTGCLGCTMSPAQHGGCVQVPLYFNGKDWKPSSYKQSKSA